MSSMDTKLSRRLLRTTTAILPAIFVTFPLGSTAFATSTEPVSWTTPDELRDFTGGNVDAAMNNWRDLRTMRSTSFEEYARFLMRYPGWPEEEKMRARAENVVNPEESSPNALVMFFEKFPPVTNSGHAAYAVALYRMHHL